MENDKWEHKGAAGNSETYAGEAFSASRRESEAGGKKFVVIRHFVGDKELSKLLLELAVSRANREMGLSQFDSSGEQ